MNNSLEINGSKSVPNGEASGAYGSGSIRTAMNKEISINTNSSNSLKNDRRPTTATTTTFSSVSSVEGGRTPILVEEDVAPSKKKKNTEKRQQQYLRADNSDDDDEVNEEIKNIYEMQKFKQYIGTSLHGNSTPTTLKMASQLRRTPGANSMHRSAFEKHKSNSTLGQGHMNMNTPLLRRTPGASAMHRSQVGAAYPDEPKGTPSIQSMQQSTKQNKRQDGANVMKFGLTLTTPVAGSRTSRTNQSVGHKVQTSTAATAVTTPQIKNSARAIGGDSNLKPPQDPKNVGVRDTYLYTPAGVSLAKNKDLNLIPGNGTLSPNTFQLAATLDELLDDKEEDRGRKKLLSDQASTSVISSPKKEILPTIQKSSSFGADSNISAVSSNFSFDDWFECFTLDTSRDQKNKNIIVSDKDKSTITDTSGNFEVPLRPKFVHNSFRTLDSSYNSDVSSANNSTSNSSVSPRNKSIQSMQRQVKLNSLPRGGSFSASHQKSFNQNNRETVIHAPTPKKVGNGSSRNKVQPAQQHPATDNQVHDRRNEHSQSTLQKQLHLQHHQNLIPPQYVETNPNAYDIVSNMAYETSMNMNMYPYPAHSVSHPMHQPIAYQPQLPTIDNPHLEYVNQQMQQLPLPPMSPATVPASMSPLTVPPYAPNMHYDSNSPVPFPPQQSHMGWAEQPPNHQWGAMGDGNWEQHHHHSNNTDFAFGGVGFFGREMNHHQHIHTPPPNHLLPPYSVPNQLMNRSGFHRSSQMYHIQEPTYQLHDKRPNNGRSHEHVPSNHQGLRTTKNNDNFDRDNSAREETSLRMGSKKQQHFDSSLAPPERSGTTKTKQSKKYNKNNKDESKKSDDPTGKGKKNGTSKKRGLIDSSARRKNKENQPQTVNSSKFQKEKRKIAESTKKKVLSPEEEAAELKRAELIETPATRAIFKDFYRKYRLKEKVSLESAAKFAAECLSDKDFPTSVHWRIYLELADISKRANKFNEARELFNQVCSIQPYASQGWLEYSKLEEECGNLSQCSRILNKGLKFCPHNENLLTRAIKHEERLAHEEGCGDLSRARELLAPLKHCGIEKVWRVVLEGALMEARAGNEVEARRVLKYLMHWIPWYGPLYLEAFRLERDHERSIDALGIVERGLKEIPRYGPLWFGAFRLCEGLDVEKNDLHLPRTLEMINRATGCISRELLWKVHLEAAQAQERGAHLAVENDQTVSLNERLSESRKRFVITISSCPSNLRWKVWLAAGRMELSAGRFEEARKLFLKSHSVVPVKGRPAVLLECARLEEFVGNSELAKAILCKSRLEEGSDWKVWLQSVSLEMRSGNRENAIKLALGGLKVHSGTGRLWAALVQLREKDGEKAQMTALSQALYAVPKSGEVWCESARIFLNPLSILFNLETAARHLEFATKFTPQYGDSFLETLRLQLLQRFVLPPHQTFIDELISTLNNVFEEETYSHSDFLTILSSTLKKAAKAIKSKKRTAVTGKNIFTLLGTVDTSKLELHCSNADPNYGKLWFHCRRRPSDTARTVMKRAKHVIGHNLGRYGYLYVISAMRRVAIGMLNKNMKKANNRYVDGKGRVEKKHIYKIPSVESLLLHEGGFEDFEFGDSTHYTTNNKSIETKEHDIKLLEGSIESSDFISGINELNENIVLQDLPLMERRKILFGSDLLL